MVNSNIALIKGKIHSLLKEQPTILLAIDGRSGAGKTTFAEDLGKALSCPVIHMDDFFLRPFQRTARRLQTPGGNVDYERFLEEVLTPIKEQKDFSYQPFDCRSQALKEPVEIKWNRIIIVEGSYSCHPALAESYDYRIFLDVEAEEQKRRIRKRNGEEQAKVFFEKWIPLEEKYFMECNIRQKCDIVLEFGGYK